MVVGVYVREERGQTFFIPLCETEEQFVDITVLQFKEKAFEALGDAACMSNTRFIFTDKILVDNSATLSSCGIRDCSHIFARRRPIGDGISRSRENLANFLKKN